MSFSTDLPGPEAHSRVEQNRQLFGALAGTYDQLGFLGQAARFFAAQVPVQAGQRVLDIGCGTGEVALALAGRGAEVVGVDLAPEMVARAQARAQTVTGVSFHVADAQALPFPDRSFDRVVSAATLFFLPDMLAAVQEWGRVLVGGGELLFSSFGRGHLGEWPGWWREDLVAAGLKPGAPPLGRLPTPQAARELLEQAGFREVRAEQTELPYTMPTAQQRLNEIVAGLEGYPLRTLAPEQQEQVKARHLARLQTLSWPQTVPIPLIVARGIRGQEAGE